MGERLRHDQLQAGVYGHRHAGGLTPGVVVVTATYRAEGAESVSLVREVVIG